LLKYGYTKVKAREYNPTAWNKPEIKTLVFK
jgi:hypothetical protein